MKPFLGIDLSENKKNEQMNGEIFLVREPSSDLTQSLERYSDNAEETLEESKLPLPIRIFECIFGFIAAFTVIGILRAVTDEDGITLKQAYQNAYWLFWLGGVCLVAWVLLKLVSIRKEKNVLENDESSRVFNNLDKTCDAILSELAVPPDSKEIDVLSFYYKVKDDRIKVCEKALQIAPYINLIFNVFADSENLYLANLQGKYAFPLSSIKAIRTVKKTIRIIEWNKDEPYNKDIYKQYKLNEDKYGCIIAKNYHILELEYDNEIWGVYVPCYELPVIEQLTGLKADVL